MSNYDIMKILTIFLLIVLTLGMGIAEGSVISLKTKVSSRFKKNTLVVKVNVTNKGNEPAYNVQISLDANNKLASTPTKDVLPANETHTTETIFHPNIKTVGRYPLIVTVDYTDLYQHPFSIIVGSYFICKKDVSPEIHGKINKIGISKSGRLVLTLNNLYDTEKEVEVKLISPRELPVTDPVRNITLGPKAEMEIRFSIKNLSAITGSRYKVFAIVSYNDNNRHCIASIPGVVRIKEGVDFLKTYKWVFIGIGIAVIIITFILQLVLRKQSARC